MALVKHESGGCRVKGCSLVRNGLSRSHGSLIP